MKKKFGCALLAGCVALFGAAAFAGCSNNTNNPPANAAEYAQWLIDNMKSNYSVSANMNYTPNNEREGGSDDESHKDTHFDALVTKSGGTTVSSVCATTTYYQGGQSKSSSDKTEFTKSSGGYSIKEFNDSKKVAKSESVGKSEYTMQSAAMLLPEAMLQVCLDNKNISSQTVSGIQTGVFRLFPNKLPSKYGVDDQGGLLEDKNKKSTVLAFGGFIQTAYSSEAFYSLEICVYENKLEHITFTESGKDENGDDYYHEGSVVYDNTQTLNEPFSKEGYYASEAECATEMISGVLQNQPARFQIKNTETTKLNGAVLGSHTDYVAYEKIGDTVYYYIKSRPNDDWEIAESYQKNGDGHIGRVYFNDNNTYKEKTCAEEVCLYVDTTNLDAHVYANTINTSFTCLAQLLDCVEVAQVEFDENGVCSVSIAAEDGGVQTLTTLYIKDNQLQKLVVELTTEISAIPDIIAGGTEVIISTSAYTYNTSAINADLSSYTKVQ